MLSYIMSLLPLKITQGFLFLLSMKNSTFTMTSMNSPLLPLRFPVFLCVHPLSLSCCHTGHTLTLDSLSSLFSSTFLLAHHEVIFGVKPTLGFFKITSPLLCNHLFQFPATVVSFYFSLAAISNILCKVLSYHVYYLSPARR